jgi:hypothetical protein
VIGPFFRTLVLLVSCGGLLLSAAWFSDSVIDDAYIVFRYADNLVAGYGPVFNPGERVEGFTSPLWLLLIAAARILGFSGESAAAAYGSVFAIAAVIASWALARKLSASWAALVAPVLLALHPAHGMWAVHGLETPLFVFLIAAAFAAWGGKKSRAAWGAGIVFGLGMWTRPEAPMFVLLLAALAVARGEGRRAARLAGGFLTLAVPMILARIAYYGTWVPNTFHAKTGGGWERIQWGLGYANEFMRSHLPLVVACAAAVVVLGFRVLRPRLDRSDKSRIELAVDLAVCGAAWSLWIVWIGGDSFPGYRFWLPAIPLAGALTAWVLGEALASRRFSPTPTAHLLATLVFLGAAAVGIASIVLETRSDVLLEYDSGKEFTARMKTVGDWLGANAPEDATIALNYVGAVPYRSGLRSIDMLGLTDAEVARSSSSGRFLFSGQARGNGASILDRRPELILMGGVYLAPYPMGDLPAAMDSEEQIAADPRFARDYERVQVPIPATGGRMWFAFYKRKDLDWHPVGAIPR